VASSSYFLLEKHDLGKKIFEVVEAHLRTNGMAMKQCTMIDATLIAAACFTSMRVKPEQPDAAEQDGSEGVGSL
jgi:IS5 family transposase